MRDTTFEQIESKIRAMRRGRDQAHGRAFEPLVKWWLQNDPVWSSLFEEVWLWEEWPDKWKVQEAGIDHVARSFKGEMWAVQAKMYHKDKNVTKRDIQSFVSESEGFDHRLLITTSWYLSFHAKDLCKRLGIVVVASENLLKSTVEWPASWAVEVEPMGIFKSPRHLGKRLRQARNKRGLTQIRLAEQAGFSVPTLRLLESGKGNLSSWQKALSALSLVVEGKSLPSGVTIGQRVAALRKRHCLSQRKLASLARTTPPTIVAMEKRSQGRLALLDSVLTVLGAGHYLAEKRWANVFIGTVR